MAEHDPAALPPPIAVTPQVRLTGSVNEEMLAAFHTQMAAAAEGDGPLVVELTTLGGDAEIGRRLALEAQIARRRLGARRLLFLGKTVVFSAGATMMAGFPREDRFLTADAVLLIHHRQMKKDLHIDAPLAGAELQVRQLLSEIANGQRVEKEGFEALIEGSKVTMDELLDRASRNWYVPAAEALELGLIAGIV